VKRGPKMQRAAKLSEVLTSHSEEAIKSYVTGSSFACSAHSSVLELLLIEMFSSAVHGNRSVKCSLPCI
jgi:hypothetical protein